ncbi:(2Fe-2S)-binding protein [Sphingomonas rubra]|uniref:Isoquinoline 1-oxidoreductase, alpha subunit n=1 Tax=Sphingomonas rubra TaxID=634430 RepID=A0A1I5PH76_9SPHN|nr:(2Fe-2S)-binding protein [Sphingomonas rubra]SFP33468.1 isoquinoline 1-oxidoreductase, alpha subunit [Sphingomonas rubra]
MTRFTVNNQAVEYRLDPATPLLWALRDASNLTGAKYGCGTGHCGACTVDVDGRAVRSCRMTIAEAEGTVVTTIEGLSREREHPIQLAFLADNVVQCGFCVPGIVMTAAALLRRDPDPSEETIRRTVTNLCRCGVYPRLVDAIRRAARAQRGEEVIPAGARAGIDPADAARTVPALVPPRDTGGAP